MENRVFGIDVSMYQRGMDFAKAVGEGVKFAIIKASEQDFADPLFETNYKAARAAGMRVGAYHYLKCATKEEAVAHAKYMIDHCLRGKVFDYPIFVDVEDQSMAYLPVRELSDIVRAFCTTLEAAGYWAGFYTNEDWYRNRLSGADLARRFSFWLAYWGSAKPDIADVQMWQFGGGVNFLRSNQIAGVVCDQDYSYMDYPSLIAAKGLNGTRKGSPTEKKTDAEKASAEDKNERSALKVGDRVTVERGAPVWGESYGFDSWVYSTPLYVREINGSRVVVSTVPEGPVTGAVSAKYLKKI